MKSIHKYKTVAWVDLVSPSVDEILEVNNDPDIANKLASPSLRHTVEFGPNHAYLVFHFPAFKDSTDGNAAYEVDFVIYSDMVVTARYGKVHALDEFDFASLEGEDKGNPRDAIFFGLLEKLIGAYEEKLVHVDHWIRDVEKKIFAGEEKASILELSEASRHLIDFKKITAVYPETIKSLAEEGAKLFGKEFVAKCKNILETLERLNSKLETLIEATHELRETNYSLLTTKQNESIKVFSIVSTVIAVLVGMALIWLGYMAIK